MTIYKEVQIFKTYRQPFKSSRAIGLTKQWRELLKIMARHMGQGGAVKMQQYGNYASVELLP